MAFARPRKLFTEEELYEYALGALARRSRSVAELKRLLRNRVEADTEFGKTLVELIVVRLKDRGYLNDARYAAAYSSYRRDTERFGRRRVVNDLKAKGVHAEVIEKAVERRKLYQKRTILFVDEVHRWNKAQQDALLPHVENGTVTLIGATTENPYFEVIGALVSRSRVFQLRPLEDQDVRSILIWDLHAHDCGCRRECRGNRRSGCHPGSDH